MVIVDTSVLIDYFADRRTPQTEWIERYCDSRPIGITSLILSEILQGIRSDRQFAETLGALEEFAVFDTGSPALAISSARNYRALRKLGVTIRSTIDCLTASFCIEESHELLHSDHDFDALERHLGLAVLHP
jgi:predicted nucleic acid-binding protein